MGFNFFLGTHMPHWLNKISVPLFISAVRLRRIKNKFPRALGEWALDSGGFSEIAKHGRWMTSAQTYCAEVIRWSREIGNMKWAAIQDWMCEPQMLQKTGLTVSDHQRRTTHSYLTLKSLAPQIPWVPVLQGFERDDYLRHLDEYHRALPFPMSGFRLVGLGSVCRRQGTKMVEDLIRHLHSNGLKIHAFGMKKLGLPSCAGLLASADSMAWSYGGRRIGGKSNSLSFALQWRESLLQMIDKPATFS